MKRFDPSESKTSDDKSWGWLLTLLGLIPFFAVGAISFYLLSLLVTDEDVYYKQKQNANLISTSTLQTEFSQIDVVAEILPHFTLVNPNDRFLPMTFVNNTYFKNMTYDEQGSKREVKFIELFHTADNTTDDLPHLNFNYDYIPAGDSRSTCLHVRERSKSLPKTNYENYSSLKQMAEGFGAKKMNWNTNDPTTGVNLLVWKEFATNNKTDGSEGIIKNNTCYEYSILKKICIIIYPTDETAQTWYFQNGGYEGGSVSKFEKAKPKAEYTFNRIPIEVWANKGAFDGSESDNSIFGGKTPIFVWVSRAGWVLGLISFIGFIIFFGIWLNYTPGSK